MHSIFAYIHTFREAYIFATLDCVECSSTKPIAMKFQELLEQHVGVFGKCQKRIIAIMLYDKLFFAFGLVSVIFLAATPPHRCSLSPYLTSHHQDTPLANCTRDQLLRVFLPPGEGDTGYSNCEVYDRNYSSMDWSTCDDHVMSGLGNDTRECDRWEYDVRKMGRTLVSQVM